MDDDDDDGDDDDDDDDGDDDDGDDDDDVDSGDDEIILINLSLGRIFHSGACDSIIFMFLGIAIARDSFKWHTGFIFWSALLCLVVRFLGQFIRNMNFSFFFSQNYFRIDMLRTHQNHN